ncbi:MAG: hypothetical protein HRT91_04285 [Piscirickettsiaceae bacterium]|nr:hypothetical protein [Piscirickettsiaceae bacterium]
MNRSRKYVGINNEIMGGMTPIGKVIRDSWVFGLISEDETCEGWDAASIDALLQKLNIEWDKYGCLVRYLPEELSERHQRIHSAAINMAIDQGWSGEYEIHNEDDR